MKRGLIALATGLLLAGPITVQPYGMSPRMMGVHGANGRVKIGRLACRRNPTRTS